MHALLVVAAAQVTQAEPALGAQENWSWVQAGTPEEALSKLSSEAAFDVVVCDLAVADQEWFGQVAEHSPRSVRLALTAGHEHEPALAKLPLAHQCVAKPLSGDALVEAINRAWQGRGSAGDGEILERLAALRSVPALPRTHSELLAELQEDEPNIVLIAEIFADDAALSAKLLQLVNSAYFGVREEVTDIKQAALLLGLDVLADLSMSHAMFEAFTGCVDELLLERLWREGHVVAAVVERLGRYLEQDTEVRRDLRVAAFIHDIGRLALVSVDTRGYEHCIDLQGQALVRAEIDRYGMDHAVAGAYLLDLWGLPEKLGACVRHHHRPPSDPSPWPHGWLVALAVRLVEAPAATLESDPDYPRWTDLSGLPSAQFSQACAAASALVHGN